MNTKANCNHSEDISEKSSKTMTYLNNNWFNHGTKIETIFCENSAKCSSNCQKICNESKDSMSRLIVELVIAIFVEEDTCLTNCDQDQGCRLQNPVNGNSFLIIE